MEGEGSHQQTFDLLAIPEEVLYRYVFPHCELNDLLRLRLVCNQTKNSSDAFIRNNFKSQEREINETDATFGDFLQRNLPTCNIYINNSGWKIFEDPDSELQFFSALSRLEHLELEFTVATCHHHGYSFRTVNGKKTLQKTFPNNFKNLKTLKLNEIVGSNGMDDYYAWDFMEFCTQLEFFKHPLYKNLIKHSPFDRVIGIIKSRHNQFPEQPNLKFYDLENWDPEPEHFDYKQYCDLVDLFCQRGGKLLNVSSVAVAVGPFMESSQNYTTPLMSIKNIDAMMLIHELPNLEKMVISTARSSYLRAWAISSNDQPKWPKLKTVDITIDSSRLTGNLDYVGQPTKELLNFLFVGNERNGLRELSIGFRESKEKVLPGRAYLPILRPQDIVMTCKNITRLSLTNWLGKNMVLSKFWEGLPLLQDVQLEECKMLGDVAFLGKNWKYPTFLKLNGLKKFSLKGLYLMPKLTDMVFKLVFRHLKIKQFCLESYEPIQVITIAGIESLLTGDFNNSVEKFPFDCWSLDGVSEEEFDQLKSKFRASYML